MRKTKIVSTIGPASDSVGVLEELSKAGMNVARQNFSHGSYEEHEERLKRIRSISDNIGVMMDTQGPEIRLKEVEDGTELVTGDSVTLVTEDIVGDESRLPVDYPRIINYLERGDKLLIDDGQIELEVTDVDDSVECRIIYGGKVLTKKSVNVPGKDIGLKAPTKKDVKDIKFAIKKGFDFVSASFVKTADDIHKINDIIESKNCDMDIIAKIEHIKAVNNLDEILDATDAVMIARGDLGVEVPASQVPLLQKRIIEKANRKEKPVITATQMLKSMTESPRATRAEVSDVANAVLDGSDAVMLSEETAVGKYPVKSVEFMSEVVQQMEGYLKGRTHHTHDIRSDNIADIIAKSVWQADRDIDVKYIIAHTSSGYTAHKIAKFRPETDILAFTDKETIQRKLNLVWGVTSFYMEFPEHVDEMTEKSAKFLYKNGYVNKDDRIILTAGVPAPVEGITNMMEIRTVKSLLEERRNKRRKK
ncbi:MAG: pyruvate kinase [Thermoplasmatota archaeon]